MSYYAIILAAGKSTRMGGKLKPFCEIAHQPLIIHLLDSIIKTHPLKIFIVINDLYQANHLELIKNFIGEQVVFEFILQEKQLGTGHAVLDVFKKNKLEVEKDLIVFYADSPLIKSQTIQNILKELSNNQANGIICGFECHVDNHYGRIACDKNHIVQNVHEYKDYKNIEAIENIVKCNSGIIASQAGLIHKLLELIDNNNAAEEYYLPDIIKTSLNLDYKFAYFPIDQEEALGVNNFHELALLNNIWQNRQRLFWLKQYVELIDMQHVYFGFNNQIGQFTKIMPNVIFKENVTVGKNVTIEANNIIGPNVVIGDHCLIKAHNYIQDSQIGENCEIGPFAHLSGKNIIASGNIIGNFVEIKRSQLGHKNKIKHLAYLGDLDMQDKNNIGAGTIICNYDGKKKHKTIIGSHNMIGANSSLIAPLQIGDHNLVAAGSVINQKIENKILAIARAKQVNLEKKVEE